MPRSTAPRRRCSDSARSTSTVLDQTFDDVELVGRPVTVGNFVNSQAAGGLIFTTTTNTYSPYIELSDEAYPDPSQDETIHGQDYQEVLTNFPLGSQILTGLFLNITLSGPQARARHLREDPGRSDRLRRAPGGRQHRPAVDQPHRATDPHQQRPLDDQRASRPPIADRHRRGTGCPQQPPGPAQPVAADGQLDPQHGPGDPRAAGGRVPGRFAQPGDRPPEQRGADHRLRALPPTAPPPSSRPGT